MNARAGTASCCSATMPDFGQQLVHGHIYVINSSVGALPIRVLLGVLFAGLLMLIGQSAQSATFPAAGHCYQQSNVVRAGPFRIRGDFADLSCEQKANSISDLVPLLPPLSAQGKLIPKNETQDGAAHSPDASNPRNESGYLGNTASKDCHEQILFPCDAQEFGVFFLIILAIVAGGIVVFKLAQVFSDLVDWVFDLCADAWWKAVGDCRRLLDRRK